MRTVLVRPGATAGPPDRGAGLPRPTIRNGNFDDGIDGWTCLGTPFRVVTLENRHYVSSYVPLGPGVQKGEDAQGALFQDFTLDNESTTLASASTAAGSSPRPTSRRATLPRCASTTATNTVS